MTSARKIKANRINAQASTGPRTKQGKARAAKNACRHGLSLSILNDSSVANDVQLAAREIAGDETTPEAYAIALRIAEAQFELVRIRRARQDVINRHFSNLEYESPKVAMKIIKLALDISLRLNENEPFPFEHFDRHDVNLEDPQRFLTILFDLSRKLLVLDRYERRTFSRRKFAIRDFDVLRFG